MMSQGLVAVIIGVLVLWLVALCDPYQEQTVHWVYAPAQFNWTIHPDCEAVYYVQPQETQWLLAHRYAPAGQEHWWINHMRYYSYIADNTLYPNQPVCVDWYQPRPPIPYEDLVTITIRH